jgi:t-SNARE complex subunit (syntaxin)
MIKNHIRRMETLVNRLAAVLRDQSAPPPRRLQTAQDVIDLLQEQVEALRAETRAGTVEKARALGYLAGIARKAIETGALAARLAALERGMNHRNGEGKR